MRPLAITFCLSILAVPLLAQDQTGGPARPAPRWADGTINLGPPPGEKGMWDGAEPLVTNQAAPVASRSSIRSKNLPQPLRAASC